MKKVIEELRLERLRHYKTQQEWDDYIGVSRGTTQKLEAGRIANCNTVGRYLDKLGYSIGIVKSEKNEGGSNG